MADLIDRDATIKLFCDDCCKRRGVTEMCADDDKCQDISVLKSVSAVNRWIPCSERLPEYGVDVLVYAKPWEDNIQVAHIQYDGIMWELSDGEFYFSKSDVTHWMPLPEPPESEVQEDADM